MKVLGVLNKELTALNINNEFYQYTKKVNYPYWVYEYIQDDLVSECNLNSGILILNGFTRNGLKDLEDNKNLIIEHFREFKKIVAGVGIAITVNGVQYINTNDEELKRIEIKLNYQEWGIN